MPKTKSQVGAKNHNPFQTKRISFFQNDEEVENLRKKHEAAKNYANKILYGMQAIDDEINIQITLPSKNDEEDEEESKYRYEDWN